MTGDAALAFLPQALKQVMQDGQWHKFREFAPLAVRIPGDLASHRYVQKQPKSKDKPLDSLVELGRDMILKRFLNGLHGRRQAERRVVDGEWEYRQVNLPPPVTVTSNKDNHQPAPGGCCVQEGKKSKKHHSPKLKKMLLDLLEELRGSRVHVVFHVTNDRKILVELDPNA